MKKKKRVHILVWTIVTLFLSGTGITIFFYSNVQHSVAGMHQKMGRTQLQKRVEPAAMNERDPISILLLGVDERESDSGRSDTMVVMAVNPHDDSMYMYIQRDTRTEIIGKGIKDKINHAYA